MRKGSTKWEDATAENPWIGSALFKTLNDKYHGIIKIVNDTEIGNYIKAMNVIGEVKSYNSENAASVKWFERGELFLPLYEEVYGYQSQTNFLRYTGLKDLELFIGSKRHISKSLGEGGTNVGWWTSSTVQNSASDFEFILFNGCCGVIAANINTNISVPICFVFA